VTASVSDVPFKIEQVDLEGLKVVDRLMVGGSWIKDS
jgi:hypothetical protein